MNRTLACRVLPENDHTPWLVVELVPVKAVAINEVDLLVLVLSPHQDVHVVIKLVDWCIASSASQHLASVKVHIW